MNIQIFIFCWNDYIDKAKEMEKNLKNFGNTTVINSNIKEKTPSWINLNNAYFAEQWNVLIENISSTTEYIFHIQSDATIPNYENLINRFKDVVYKHKNIGVYAPNVDYTWHTYDLNKLNKIEESLYEVPNTDCTCWFINRELIDNLPLYNVNTNYIGYGADWYYIAKSRLNNKLVIRDYTITILHPNLKGYDAEEGNRLFYIWLEEQDVDINREIKKMFKEVEFSNLNYLS